MPRSNPNDWKKYQKQGRSTSLTGGMTFGSDENGLGEADFLSREFEIGGGAGLTPQQQSDVTAKAIRGGGVMKSPDTSVTPADLSFITASPDGGNYMTPREPEIPPYLRRDPTPEIQPSALVQPQAAPGGGRTSSVADAMPIRDNYRKREAMAAKLEASALKAQNSGWANFLAPDQTARAVMQRSLYAQQLRQMDDADYQRDVGEFFIKNPGRRDEWVRQREIASGKPARVAPVNAIDPVSRDLVSVDELGRPKRFPGVMPQNTFEIAAVGERMREDDQRKAEQDRLDRENRLAIANIGKEETQMRTGAVNRQTDLRKSVLSGLAPEAVEYPDDKDRKEARKNPNGEEAGLLSMGFQKVNAGSEEEPKIIFARPKKLNLSGGGGRSVSDTKAGAAPTAQAAPELEEVEIVNGKLVKKKKK